MVRLDLYFLNKEDFKKWKKEEKKLSDVIKTNPETEFHKKVLKELNPYLKEIREILFI